MPDYASIANKFPLVKKVIYAPFPGEFMESALRRGKEVQGIRNFRKNDFHIQKIRPTRSKGSWRLVLPSFFVDDNIAKQAVNENTLYPLFAVLGRCVHDSKYTPTRGWKICKTCVTEDTQSYGSPYIHVAHLPRSVTLCYKHAVQLHDTCPSCGIPIYAHQMASLTDCSASFPEPATAIGTPHHDYALFVKDLLNFRGSTYNTISVSRNLSEKYVRLMYGENYALGYSSYRSDISLFLGMVFKDTNSEYHSFDMSLALAFLVFKNADSFISFIQRPISKPNPRETVISSAPQC